MNREVFQDNPVDIVISFYRNPHLVSPLFQSLEQAPVAEELNRLRASIIAVNDSPDDLELKKCLQCAVDRARALAPCELLENNANIGFVRSVNRGLQRALDQGHDVIILNSDTIVSPGALSEMRDVGYVDPMIGFVSPRSNNATICSFPHQNEFRGTTPAESHAVFLALQGYLPRFQFVPVAVGFCLFIKLEVLKEFGLLDESYSPGYNEENDLIMRANRCGYRAALANRAWIYHVGEASFSVSQSRKEIQEQENGRLLNQRYPEYQPSVRRYLNGERYQGERLLVGLLPDGDGRLDLLFDFSSMGPFHNGTVVACRKILERAVRLWPQFNLYVMVSDETRRFHELDRLAGVSFVPLNVSRKFAVGFRFSQPFNLEQISRLSRLAAVNVYGMLDPIASDCLYLNSDNPDDLETLWSTVFGYADGVVYISDLVCELFRRRFRRRRGLHELVAYPSLDIKDYKNPLGPGRASGQHILVVGNRFDHKRVAVTVSALSKAFQEERIVVIGSQLEAGQNVVSFASGYVDSRKMHGLYSDARFVVFPSLYEGFGFPVLESLAYEKPIFARAIPVIQAIRDKIGRPDNLILFSSTNELIEQLRQGFPTWSNNGAPPLDQATGNWDATTRSIGNFLQETVRTLDFDNVLLPRIAQMYLLEQRAEAPGDGVSILGKPYSLAAAVRDRDLQIQQIHASWSWRLTSPVRWLGGRYLRAMK
jgi:GT2 family glycosyltransferase